MKHLALSFAALAAIGAAPCLGQAPGPVTVINYAGFTGLFPVAPGSIASAYGDFGAGVAATGASGANPLPREIAGVRLRIGGTDAPLYYVSRNQINLVVPVATAIGRQTAEVVSGGNVVARGNVNVYDFAPGLASNDPTPSRQGIIQNQDFAINGPSARARRGETIQLYATGCGATNPQSQDGVPPSSLSPATALVRAFVSVEEAAVQFAGAQPQFPGICQVNLLVPNLPNREFITGQAPVFITVNGIASNPVTVWVE